MGRGGIYFDEFAASRGTGRAQAVVAWIGRLREVSIYP